MTKSELKELIKEVINEARYSAADKQFVANWANEGNRYIEKFISDLYNRKKNDVINYFKTVKIPKIKSEIKNQVKIGDYNKAAKSKENLQKFETALKDDPFFGKFSLEKYIMSWIDEKYPDFTGYFAGANFGQTPKIGYSLNALAKHNNTALESLEDEFVEWYKENFDGSRKFKYIF